MMRRTHYINGKQVGKSNDIYIAEVTKIYKLNNNIPIDLLGKRKMPKILKDDLSQMHKNKSDFIEQNMEGKKDSARKLS